MYSKNKCKLYDTKRWVRKARTQLALHPLCVYCLEQGLVVPADVADHIVPHKGDAHLFFYGRLQSLCHACHSGTKQQEEHQGFHREIGLDGWPTDPNHAVYRA
jgi:5-methylcytosine-specific restriction protein A